jgi:hypothetical protein
VGAWRLTVILSVAKDHVAVLNVFGADDVAEHNLILRYAQDDSKQSDLSRYANPSLDP